MIIENLSTLKINKLSQEQYDREFTAGRIDENAIYLTPDNNTQIETITNSEIDEIFEGIFYSISYSLGENSISSNVSEDIYNGNSYITTLSAVNGYKITNV